MKMSLVEGVYHLHVSAECIPNSHFLVFLAEDFERVTRHSAIIPRCVKFALPVAIAFAFRIFLIFGSSSHGITSGRT